MRKPELGKVDLELRIELLKERIYATLALTAVLLTIDAGHTTALRAAELVLGTAGSLWAASLVAGTMAYRVVAGRHAPERWMRRQVKLHSPLLAAAVFPLAVIGLAAAGLLSLDAALDVAMGASILLLVVWSLLSARALKVGWVTTILLAGVELGLGLGIIWLKMAVEH